MSGILGIYYLNGQTVDPENIQQMVDKLAHRGPDGADIWCSESVGLGHRMLWTTPESLLEKLPMVSEDGNLVITSDCRIDNREELLSRLQMGNCPPEKVTDTQLILAAYQEWGEDCPQHLLGDFAFAIWDGREKKLFCARDHFGVKPFYYYASDDIFVFGSEIKAIIPISLVKQELNVNKIADFITSRFEDKTSTFYKQILRLPPAHCITVRKKAIDVSEYWSLDPNNEIILGSDEEYAEAFRNIFTEAVRCRMRSAFTIGSLLSGGLDSSSITCVASKILAEKSNKPLPTFSAIFDQVKECDERIYQDAVTSQGNFEKHQFHADRVGPLHDFEQVLHHQDEPFCAGNLFLNCGLYNLASQQNIRVILDGFDGDSTVSHGVGHLYELAISGKWLTLIDEAFGNAKNFGVSFPKIIWFYIWRYSFLLKPIRRIWNSLHHRIKRDVINQEQKNDLQDYLNPDFRENIAFEEGLQNKNKSQSGWKTERERHHQLLNWGLAPYVLEIIDKAAAMYGIEPRFPFWDKRLVEFCLALPPKQKFHYGWTRFILRQGMNNILPKEVQWRVGKTMMGYNFRHGFLNFDQEILKQVFTDISLNNSQYLNVGLINKAFKCFTTQDNGKDGVVLWNTIALTLWLRKTNLSSKGGDVL